MRISPRDKDVVLRISRASLGALVAFMQRLDNYWEMSARI
jgi:hypothetical protein